MALSPAQILAKKRWIEAHPDKHKASQRKYALANYYKNRDTYLDKKAHEYYVKKTFKEFLFPKML
jgi:hypothetical protein